ncbi:glycosyltransferase [Angustibacter luteus]|uniref:Glycosyltransferase n=1 Tax=Angustibacter luteus TaxID=658456 RepID=A0ABW1JHH5_9ACTN
MRILAVTTWYPSDENPVVGVFVQRHLAAIAARHDVRVAHVTGSTTGEPAGSPSTPPVHRYSKVPTSLVGDARALRAHAARWRPDVVHTMAFSSLPWGAVARGPSTWVHTEHWSGVSDPASAGRYWSALRGSRHLLRWPHLVTSVSSYLDERVAPFTRDGAHVVVPNVVAGPEQPLPWLAQAPGTMNLLSVGGLNAIKNPLLAVETLAELRRRGHQASLRWAGSGALQVAVRSRSVELGVGDHLELVGQVPPDQLAQHHGWSTCFLLPSEHETFCVAGAEALLHGRPVVLGGTGGQRDFVTADLGRLVAQRSPTAYADAVEDAHTRLVGRDPETFAAPVRARFNPVAVADDFDEAYAVARSRRG